MLQNIEKSRKNFGNWIMKQMEAIHQTKKEVQEIKSDHAIKKRENQEKQNSFHFLKLFGNN